MSPLSLKANVDPIADTFIDDRGHADSTWLGKWLQARGNIDAVAIDIVAFDNDIAKIDTDPHHDGWLRRALIRR